MANSTTSGGDTVEGIARVVRIADGVVWLEPEPTSSCGACAASAQCGSKGIGSVARRIEARRFAIADDNDLAVGDRIVVGVAAAALVRAAVAAYGVPLAVALAGGGSAQWLGGGDLATMAGTGAGLAFGMLAARFGARRLSADGQLAPRFLRRARPGESCAGE